MRKQFANRILLLTFLLLLVLPFFINSSYHLFVLCTALINIMAVLGLNFIFGLAGQLHMGMAGFMGLAAYGLALSTTKLQIPFWPGLLVSILVCSCAGLLLGIPTLRLKTFYLAIMTIGFSEVVRYVLQNWMSFTGGVWGVAGIPRPVIFGFEFNSNQQFYYLLLGTAILLTIVAMLIESSKFGRAFKAVHDDELATEAMGINSTHVKILAFLLCAIYGAVAGSFFASFHAYISPEIFKQTLSFTFVCMLVIGGLGSITGSVVGAVLLTIGMEALRFLGEWYLVVYAALLIIIIVYSPRGLMGLLESAYLKYRGQSTQNTPVGSR
ncbi:MAG: branched-chain amino acid ABC transporter permease [Limnochordia bacterium]|jgi:branched-chain amino acid transport system permease protein